MFKLTERIGEIELSYEHETLQGVMDLRNAVNPPVLRVKDTVSEDIAKSIKEAMEIGSGIRYTGY